MYLRVDEVNMEERIIGSPLPPPPPLECRSRQSDVEV